MKKAGKFFGKTLLHKMMKEKEEAKAAQAACKEATAAAVASCNSSGAIEPAPLASPPLPPPAVAEKLKGLKVVDKVWIRGDKYGRQWTGVECVAKSFAGGSAMQVETEALRHHTVQCEELELRSGLKPVSVMKTLRQVTAALREK